MLIQGFFDKLDGKILYLVFDIIRLIDLTVEIILLLIGYHNFVRLFVNSTMEKHFLLISITFILKYYVIWFRENRVPE